VKCITDLRARGAKNSMFSAINLAESKNQMRRVYTPVLVYFVVSVVWILFSDNLLTVLIADQEEYVRAQTIKGWLFVVASSFLLYAMIKKLVMALLIQTDESNRQKQKLEVILRSTGEGVFVTDKNRRILMVNKAMERISGFAEDELLGRVYNEKLRFVSEKTGKEMLEIPRIIHGKGVAAVPEEPGMLIRKDGKKVPVDGIGSPYKDEYSRVIGGIGVIRDVSADRWRERMKNDFVSLASHQLKSPLTGIKWFVELMAEKCQELEREQMLEYIHKIGDSNQHLIDLVGDLLSVSRVESEKAREKRRVTNIKLKTLLIEAVEEVKMLTEEKKVTIEGVDAMSEKIMLKGDKTQLLQVFSNVVNNAVKFSHDGGVVGVSVKTKGKRVVVCVSDKGIGIPRRQLKKVSEKFFRADNASKISTGSGLGLYIVTRLLEIHGGSFRIESEENRGTKVYVELPIMYNGR